MWALWFEEDEDKDEDDDDDDDDDDDNRILGFSPFSSILLSFFVLVMEVMRMRWDGNEWEC